MKVFNIGLIAIFCGLLGSTASLAQPPRAQGAQNLSHGRSQLHVPAQYQHSRSPFLQFISSDEGRLFLQMEGHPLAKVMEQRLGPVPSETKLPGYLRELLEEQKAALADPVHGASAAGAVPCSGPTATRFNLEPRQFGVAQDVINADFLLNGVAMNDDLVVQTAGDFRSLLMSGWDGSFSGYYVHRSATADCSVQFEGGLPNIAAQGDTLVGGGGFIQADSGRNAFFIADFRLGAQLEGIGLFRAAASDLTNPKLCPDGTHTLAQATSCWTQTPPVALDVQPMGFAPGIQFTMTVDERTNKAGTGAGDVYVLYGDNSGNLNIVACTNALKCGSPLVLANTSTNSAHVMPNGVLTVSGSASGNPSFFTCTPSGAPKPPVCAPPVTVPFRGAGISFGDPLQNENGFFFSEQTTLQHATRPGPGSDFTAFVVFDDCLSQIEPQAGQFLCLAAEVSLTISTDSGKTWSTPISVDTKPGHHFFSNVAVDGSTGTASIVYLSTEGDPNFQKVRVLLNQIAPGSTKLGPPQMITTTLDQADAGAIGLAGAGIGGAVSRGTGSAGHSRLYMSISSSAVNGIYQKKPLPDLNNHISLFTF